MGDDDNLDLADLLAKRGRTPEEEQRDYEMKIGRAIDTLRADYPDMLSISPDFSLYHDKIEVADPSGVKLHNLRSYKTSFQFLHTPLSGEPTTSSILMVSPCTSSTVLVQ